MISPKAAVRLALLSAGLLGATAWGCGNPEPTPAVPNTAVGSNSNSNGVTKTAEPADRDALPATEDPYGVTATSVVYLDQNWSVSDSLRFYFTTEGSQVLPYEWFLDLEQPDNQKLFRDTQNILKYRYLPQKPGAMNPDGLPVGFVRDKGRDRDWLGFTCAACHTGEIRYKNVAYRVDGAPALADITGLLRSMAAALTATRDQSDKFDRFARKVLTGKDSPVAREGLKAQMSEVIKRREGYNARNFPAGEHSGFGRIDAFGAILNEVYHHAVPAKDLTSNTTNTKPANAPTSTPFLWDTPQHDLLQWNGSASNSGPANIGSLGRNVGEVLGVFGDFEIPENPGPFGYSSSVQVNNLRSMEEWVTTLWSPLWPKDFPAIDSAKRAAGRTVFAKHCNNCHKDIDRTDPKRKVVAQMTFTGTDPLMATNFSERTGKAGKLQGGWSLFFPLAGEKIPAEAPGGSMLKNAVIGTIVGSPFKAPPDELTKIDLDARKKAVLPANVQATPEPGPKYKGRPLNGIWATAPYLHNGSVPSLAALLLPAKERPTTFTVGSLEFDPEAVGYKQDAKGVFTFRVLDDAGKPIPGNSNAGHEYTNNLSKDERAQLLEYLKSL